MKIMLLSFALIFSFAVSSASTATVPGVTNLAQKERATTNFDKPVNLLGVELKGEYLFVHDNAAMMRGEACTFVYKGKAEVPESLILTFHCTHESRKKAA